MRCTSPWNSLNIATLLDGLQKDGVVLRAGTSYHDDSPPPGARLVAVHPWQVASLGDLPFDFVRVPVYLNTSEWGHPGADARYRDTPEISHAAFDIDRYRPDIPDFGV